MAVLILYVTNLIYLILLGAKNCGKLHPAPSVAGTALPFVTVQLPIYNEWYVADRLLAACAELDYPRDRLEIQVLDDLRAMITSLIAQKVNVLFAPRAWTFFTSTETTGKGSKPGRCQRDLNLPAGNSLPFSMLTFCRQGIFFYG